MVKYVCDICGKEITSKIHTIEYKLKKVLELRQLLRSCSFTPQL